MKFKKILSVFLTATLLLCAAGCAPKQEQTQTPTVYPAREEPYLLGEGETSFSLEVIHLDGGEVHFELSTDEATVGAALVEAGLITGVQGPYGLMITVVNGEEHSYETDGTYWGFYIGGEYAMAGVDETDLIPGETYTLKAEAV